jgi:putative ATPase
VHKSLRGGSADAALYYVARMLTAGENPRYVTRRLIRFASEDIGLADPVALTQAVAADQSVAAIGMPEAGVVIAQCVIYLALAPKSCAVYRAYNQAVKACKELPHAAVPLQIRNAPTAMMKHLGYSSGYVYNPANGCACWLFEPTLACQISDLVTQQRHSQHAVQLRLNRAPSPRRRARLRRRLPPG